MPPLKMVTECCFFFKDWSANAFDCLAGLSAQNHKLRDRVAALLNEARYKDSVNNTLKEEIAHMLAKNQGPGVPSACCADCAIFQGRDVMCPHVSGFVCR